MNYIWKERGNIHPSNLLFVKIVFMALFLYGCENYKITEVDGIQNAEEVIGKWHIENNKKSKNSKPSNLINKVSLQWEIYLNHGSDPLLTKEVDVDDSLCNGEHIFCHDGYYFWADKKNNEPILKEDSKIQLVGKFLIGENLKKPKLVEVISLKHTKKDDYELRCKTSHFLDLKQGNEFYIKKEISFYKQIGPTKFQLVPVQELPKIWNLFNQKKVKIQEIILSDSSVGRMYRISDNLWVEGSVFLEGDIWNCKSIELLRTSEGAKYKIKEGKKLVRFGEWVSSETPDLKTGIQCQQNKTGVIDCLWRETVFNRPEDKISFTTSEFNDSLEPYATVSSKKVSDTSKHKDNLNALNDSAEFYEEKAEILFNAGKIKEAFLNFHKACELNSAKACYNNGVTLTQELKLQAEGMEYYFKACKLKFAPACYNIGGVQLKGDIQSRQEALKNFKVACSLGLEQSCLAHKRLEKVFTEKKGNLPYEQLFEILFPEIIEEMKKNGQYEGVNNFHKI